MTRDVHDAIGAAFDEYAVVGQLHDVPPHEVYEVRVDGRRAVCKVETGATGRAGVEGRVLRFVGEHTSVPVPEVLAVGDDYFVAAWHPAAPAPDAARDPDEAWARAAGRGLATLHAETAARVDGYGAFRVADGELGGARRDDWHDAALASVRRVGDVLAAHGHGDVATAARELLRERPDAFAGAGPAACCHGWWTPAHVAVDAGTVRCVVDFEHAVAAPGEWDYWRTVLPTFDGGAPQAAFRAGYEAVRSLPDGVARRRPYYVLLHSLYYFESLYVQAQHGPAETARRADWLRERVFAVLDDLGHHGACEAERRR